MTKFTITYNDGYNDSSSKIKEKENSNQNDQDDLFMGDMPD